MYTIGVKQGDNMAPILFLVLMQAATETLLKKWTQHGLTPLNFQYPEQTDHSEHGPFLAGQPINQPQSLSILQIFCILFVDDGAFIFETRNQLIKGAQLIYDTFKQFGLNMHIGKDGKPSKTEAMFFPATPHSPQQSTETEMIQLQDGTINYCDKFKYLGAIINPQLSDHQEITTRILKAQGQIAALMNIFVNKKVSLDFKVLLYKAIPLNTILWGCESWTLHADLIRKLRSFHHKSIRRILGISMAEVQERNITNQRVRQQFNSILDIHDEIKYRQLKWLGKLAANNKDPVSKALLFSHVNHPRKPGRPQLNLRHSYIPALRELFPDMPNQAPLHLWYPTAMNQQKWNQKVKQWKEQKLESYNNISSRRQTRSMTRQQTAEQ